MMIARRLAQVLLLAVLPPAGVAAAQMTDPPTRVGRVSFLEGTVSFRPGGEQDWTDATLNYPLTTDDHLWTDADARAEITMGSTAIRLAPYSAFGFLALDDHSAQLRLSQGSLQVTIRRLDPNDNFEIDTPNGAVSLLRTGTYRIDVDSTGDTTTITVRSGEAEVTAAGSAFSVRPDEAATLVGTDSPTYDIHQPYGADEWEDWCASRDRRANESRSSAYVSRDMPGYEDLDQYGSWQTTSAYGPVWVPRAVAVGWAPYRDGHWAWVDPWGWTWIDDAPWGFAPFHYGRWVRWGGAWGWVPGRVAARPVYAPALVAFVGGGAGGFSLRVGGGGGVGWFPLAPGEVYVPAYHVSQTYVRQVNVTNVNITNVNITNVDVTRVHYRNRDVAGGVTVVSQETFVGARPVNRNVVVVPRGRLVEAPIVGSAAPLAPTRESVFARRGVGPVRRPPDVTIRREVVVRTQPPPAPLPFAVREKELQAHPGRPLDNSANEALRARSPQASEQRVRPARAPVPEGGRPAAPALRPARGGLPALRPATPVEERAGRQPPAVQGRPAEPTTPVERPAPNRGERPQPAERAAPAPAPTPEPGRRQDVSRPPTERPAPAERPAAGQPPAAPSPSSGQRRDVPRPADRPTPTERPTAGQPPAAPSPSSGQRRDAPRPAERPTPAERPAPAPPQAAPPSPSQGREAPRQPVARPAPPTSERPAPAPQPPPRPERPAPVQQPPQVARPTTPPQHPAPPPAAAAPEKERHESPEPRAKRDSSHTP